MTNEIMNLGAPYRELVSLGRGTTTVSRWFRRSRDRSSPSSSKRAVSPASSSPLPSPLPSLLPWSSPSPWSSPGQQQPQAQLRSRRQQRQQQQPLSSCLQSSPSHWSIWSRAAVTGVVAVPQRHRDRIEQHYTDDLVLSTSQESRSRSCYNGSRKPRTRWKNDDRDRANPFGESVNFSRICIANVTNVPSVDAFSYTAYNDENDIESCRDGKDESRAASSSEAGDARFGEDERRGEEEEEETKFRRVRRSRDEYEASQVVEGICGEEGERYRKFRDRGELNCWGGRGSRTRVKVRAASVNGGKRESHYTARFQRNPITNGSGENVTKLSTNGPTTTKVSSNNNNNNNNNNWCGRKYGLLFILYLLACPVVCSANPSGQFIPDFTHNPSLVQNLPRHNATQISSLLLSSSVAAHQRQQQQQQHQQYQQQRQHYRQMDEGEQGTREQLVRDVEQYGGKDGGHHRRRHEEQQQDDQAREQREVEESAYRDREAFLFETESTHPYNEYSWKVNQINPWLSACDLAGPAPADLQASCDPPEVPKNCPLPCVASSGGKGGDAEFFEVMKKVKVGGNCYWSNGEREEKAVESGRFGSSSIKSFGAEGSGEGASERKGRGDDGENGEGVRMVPEQCLFYLEESHKRNICRDDFGRASTLTPRENRYWFMSGLRLRHCCDHAVVNALAPGKGGPLENVLNGGQKCADALDKLLHVDTLAAKLHCGFEEVVARYDCAQPYSVIFNCTHCKFNYSLADLGARNRMTGAVAAAAGVAGSQVIATLSSESSAGAYAYVASLNFYKFIYNNCRLKIKILSLDSMEGTIT
ncbi:hypothetical protein APICC_06719 [Apis cerana cerana]|uniref:Uncharacterized protein n=1 Tax=Apis cerana cerana TaxID=94128 RepID=A0A2A3EA27_APICC|nr:hypothetical protein APICC_06719 [Apis cerana cerana]